MGRDENRASGSAAFVPVRVRGSDDGTAGRDGRTRIDEDAGASKRCAYVAVGILLALGLVLCVLAIVSPHQAVADDAKHAIPSIAKAVSLDKKRYAEAVTTKAGGAVHYRITLTMPESVEKLPKAVYTVHDTPPEGVTVDASSVSARIVGADGRVKATLALRTSRSRSELAVVLGDLKEACADVRSDDSVVVDYDASVAASAKPKEYPNVAKLVYDLGDGEQQTVGVMAKVIVEAPAETAPPSKMPKTGDVLAGASVLCLATAAGSAFSLAYARRKRD